MGVLRQLPHRRLLLHKLLCDFPDFWFVERPELCSQFGELVAFAVAVGAGLPEVGDETSAGLKTCDESDAVAGGAGGLEVGDQHKALGLTRGLVHFPHDSRHMGVQLSTFVTDRTR